MKAVSGKRLAKLAEEHGFILRRSTGSHHIYRHEDGRRSVIPVHGNKDLPVGTQRAIMKDIGLTDADL